MPTTTVDMYVLSVKPVDFDNEWCVKADTLVKEKLKSAANSSNTIIVKVKHLFFDYYYYYHNFYFASRNEYMFFRLN